MDNFSNYFRVKDNLPGGWKVYLIDTLVVNEEEMILIKGRIARTLKRGKNIGELIYDGGCLKTYLISLEEYEQIKTIKAED